MRNRDSDISENSNSSEKTSVGIYVIYTAGPRHFGA